MPGKVAVHGTASVVVCVAMLATMRGTVPRWSGLVAAVLCVAVRRGYRARDVLEWAAPLWPRRGVDPGGVG